MKYVAFIPLRGGSRSIPRKNILPIGGKPLCQWVIEAACRAESVDRVYVATDDAEIRGVVEGIGLDGVEVIGRGAHTATDTASTESAMIEFADGRSFGHLVLIQATSPLLTAADIDSGVAAYEAAGADSLVSVVPQKRFIWEVSAAGDARATNYDPIRRPRRQDFDGYHVENGAFYISERRGLLANNSRLFGRIIAHVMAEESLVELDEPADWTVVEAFLKQRASGPDVRADFARRARSIKVVLTDVDGVLTDSGMYYGEQGDELKRFNTRDGKGLQLLREAGMKVGIVTAEDTRLVARRAAKLKVDYLHQGALAKVPRVEAIIADAGVTWAEVAYIGDDLGDVDVMSRVGLAACPADAVTEARAVAHYRCSAAGGRGCVREFAEAILAARAGTRPRCAQVES